MQRLEITRPDDFHLHLRDGERMAAVIGASAARFARAVVMPNLSVPVTGTAQALAYRERILAALPPGSAFEPLMTLYLTESTAPEEIRRARASARVCAVKLYPAGATTHSGAGVRRIERVWPVLEAMQREDLPLLIHGEVTDPQVDVFDREAVFIERVLAPLQERFPALRMVLEHITTAAAVRFVRDGPATLAATITPQHLRMNRNALFDGGLRPHHYCLPVLKRERDRQAVLDAALSGHPRFFLGTDSAPHPRSAKLAACGCAGVYSACAGIELYAEVFEDAGALQRLEAFAAHHGADFYRLPRNAGRLVLERRPWRIPAELPFGDDCLVPLGAGQTCRWQVGE